MRPSLKKKVQVSAVIFAALLLSACGDDEPGGGDQSLKTYDGGEFTIGVPTDWKVISPSDFYAEIPKETLVAFTTPEAFNGFFINVNVLREDLKQEVTSVDYARANINLSAQNLTDYKKIQEAKITISGQPSFVHIFEARLNPAEKIIRFIQVYAAKGEYGYIVTGGLLPDTPQDIRDQVGTIVTSFSLK